MRLRIGRTAAMVTALLLAQGLTAAPAANEVPEAIVAELARLRALWPETPEARIESGGDVAFSGGVIRIGRDALDAISNLPEADRPALLPFLLAHESWHGVQKQRLPTGEHERMREAKLLECEADYMGGAQAYRALALRGLDGAAMAAALDALQRYLVESMGGRTTGLADAEIPRLYGKPGFETYPGPELRAITAALGWYEAGNGQAIRQPADIAAPADAIAAAHDICRLVVRETDGSLGMLSIESRPLTQDIIDGVPGNHFSLIVRNAATRPVEFEMMSVATFITITDFLSSRPVNHSHYYDFLRQRVTVPAKGEMPLDFFVPVRPAGSEAVVGSSAVLLPAPTPWIAQALTASRYIGDAAPAVVPMKLPATAGNCAERIDSVTVPDKAERTLLRRVATIAFAAQDDFRPILRPGVIDMPQGSRRRLLAGLEASDFDGYFDSGTGTRFVSLNLKTSTEKAALLAAFVRIRKVFSDLCGEANIETVDSSVAQPVPGMPLPEGFSVNGFDPGARILISWFPGAGTPGMLSAMITKAATAP